MCFFSFCTGRVVEIIMIGLDEQEVEVVERVELSDDEDNEGVYKYEVS